MTAELALAVVLAGAVGALLRFGVAHLFARMPARLPWAVLVVNVVGSLIAGAVVGLAQGGGISGEWALVLITGLAGGLTTFSTFSVETVQLVHQGRWRAAVVSVSANLVLGVGAAALGFVVAVLLTASL